jgi:hypothetical protein
MPIRRLMNSKIRPSKKAVPTLSSLISSGFVAGLLLSIACPLSPLGIGRVSVWLLRTPHSLTSLATEESGLMLVGCMGILMLILGGITGARTITGIIRYRELKAHGVTTQGRIVDQWIAWFDFSAGRRLRRYMAYEYGDGYTAKQPLPLWRHEYAQIGTPVTVRYLPRDPSISHVECIDDKWQIR